MAKPISWRLPFTYKALSMRNVKPLLSMETRAENMEIFNDLGNPLTGASFNHPAGGGRGAPKNKSAPDLATD